MDIHVISEFMTLLLKAKIQLLTITIIVMLSNVIDDNNCLIALMDLKRVHFRRGTDHVTQTNYTCWSVDANINFHDHHHARPEYCAI